MSDIAGHPLLSLVQAETASLLEQDRAEVEEAARQETAETQAAAMRNAAEAAAKVAADADAIESEDPPCADELGIDVTGLGERRGLLVRFAAWIASLEQRLEKITAGRAVFVQQLGIKSVTEKALSDLIAGDRHGLLAWMRAGSVLDRPVVRAYEREQLSAKLIGDGHEVETARAAIAAADHEIDVLSRQLSILRSRHRTFVMDAVLEHAGLEGAGVGYMRAIETLQDRLAELLGLAHIVGGHSGFYRSMRETISAEIDMPRFALPGIAGHLGATMKTGTTGGPGISVSGARAASAAGPWRDLVKLWTSNPLAQPATQQEK